MNNKIPVFDLEYIKYYPYTNRIDSAFLPILHTHTFWEISYVIKGKMNMCYDNGQKVSLTVGDIIVIRPNDCHYCERLTDDLDYRDIYITCGKMEKICDSVDKSMFAKLTNGNMPLVYHLGNTHLLSIEKSAFLLGGYKNFSQECEELHSFLIFRILYLIKEILLKNRLSSAMSKIVVEAMNIIDKDPIEMNVKKVAEKMGYSVVHLNRLFNQNAKMSCAKYIQKSRLIYSTGLLANSNFTIASVAMEIGFSSQVGYIKAFKKMYNETPSEWRERFYREKKKDKEFL